MKNLLRISAAFAISLTAFAQNITLQKAPSTNILTSASNPIVFGNGQTLTMNSGATLNIATGAYFTAPAGFFTWASLDKTGSSLADLQTRSASDLSTGTLPNARFPSVFPAIDGSALTNLNGAQIVAGTVADARITAALTSKTYNGVTLTGSSAPSLAVTGTTTVSGVNTGDQTTVTGNAGTATALLNPRTIGGSAFDGTANVTSFPSPGAIGGGTPSTASFTTVNGITLAGSSSPALTVTGTTAVSGSNTGDQSISIIGDATAAPSQGTLNATVTKINGVALSGLATGILKNTTATGVPSIAIAADFPILNQNTTGNAQTASVATDAVALFTARTIGGSSFDGTANVTSFPSPGSIGGTTPSTGAFTTVNGNTITTGTGTLTLGSATLNAGTGGTLGSAAFTASSSYLSYGTNSNTNLVYEGDSLTTNVSPPSGAGNDWPDQASTLSSFVNQGTSYNVATSGDTLANIVSQYSSQVYPRRPTGAVTKAFLWVWIGSNDIATAVAATWLTSWNSYVSQARTDGFTVIAFTVMKRTDTLSFEATRLAMNAGIRQSNNWDMLIDADAIFPDPTNLTFFLVDGIHLNSAGNKYLANYVNSQKYANGSFQNPSYGIFSGPISASAITATTGKLTLPSGTTNALGIAFGDTNLYRITTGILESDSTVNALFVESQSDTSGAARFRVQNTGSGGAAYDMGTGGSANADSQTRAKWFLSDVNSGGTVRVTLDSAGLFSILASGGGLAVTGNSSAAKLTLTSGTTASNGIVWGSDVNLYRVGQGILQSDTTGDNALFIEQQSTTTGAARFRVNSSGVGGRSFDMGSAGASSSITNAASKWFLTDQTAGATRLTVDLNGLLSVLSTTGGIAASSTIEATTGASGSITTAGGIYAAKSVIALHHGGTGTAPTIAAGTGAGTSPTVSVTGHDAAFTISVTTGTLPTLSATIATVTFNTAYANAPHFSFTPSNSNSSTLNGVNMVTPSSTTTTFVLTAGATALTAATTYTWEVIVVQ